MSAIKTSMPRLNGRQPTGAKKGTTMDDILPAGVRQLPRVNRRPNFSKISRFKCLKRDEWTCQWCGAKAPRSRLVLDHIIPFNRRGPTVEDNLITACQPCNAGRKDGCFITGLCGKWEDPLHLMLSHMWRILFLQRTELSKRYEELKAVQGGWNYGFLEILLMDQDLSKKGTPLNFNRPVGICIECRELIYRDTGRHVNSDRGKECTLAQEKFEAALKNLKRQLSQSA